jgi:hypothetical protein
MPCAFCENATVPKGSVTYDGAYACRKCRPYAWASVVHPEFRSENMAIAMRRFGKGG